ncbi:hypothetical protein HID58_066857 [Brassica napus]|uniref:Uncharacterized protein n=1 Tax=Brassica napus TaxID=3708 RepID=A0ABQ7ZH44_BRANA|nr:hypothetical protein HID58_066857 [Brassica napus]
MYCMGHLASKCGVTCGKTVFRWKIKLEASSTLPDSTLREHMYNSGVPVGIDHLSVHVELGTKSFSITLSHEMDDCSNVTFPLWETLQSLKLTSFTFSTILDFSTTLL